MENGEEGDETDDSALDKNKNKIVPSSPSNSYHSNGVIDHAHSNKTENEATQTKITAENLNSTPDRYITPEEKVAAILRGRMLQR